MFKFLKKINKFVYPCGKVHKNYGRYVYWSLLSNAIGSMEGVLSTHSMLSVVGKESNELVISVNYIGKDIVGQLGGLWYINKMAQKSDEDPKAFAKYSILFEQTSNFLECATPLLPTLIFIPTAGIANIGKNISAIGIGAVNAKIIQKLAKENNIGEIYSKIGVLNTIGSSIGMGFGLILTCVIPCHTTRLCIIPILAYIRYYCYQTAIEGTL